jgi:hypothetical protein
LTTVGDSQKLEISGSSSSSDSILKNLKNVLTKVTDNLYQRFPNDPDVIRLKSRFTEKTKFREKSRSDKYNHASYTVNKGKSMVFCIKNPNEMSDEFYNFNDLVFVGLHELAHVMTKDTQGHDQAFWFNFKRLLRTAVEMGLYKSQDYSKYPVEYCGDAIDDSPIF